MHIPAWFFPTFFGFFFLLCGVLGWFVRKPVWWISIAVVATVFLAILGLEVFTTYDPPNFSIEKVQVSAFVAGMAVIPVVVGTAFGRFLKNRRK